MQMLINTIIGIIIGSIFGSFFAVVLTRSKKFFSTKGSLQGNVVELVWVKEGESLNTRSRCDNCQYQLKAYDNIPIISYLIYGGKCRRCKNKISLKLFTFEVLFALFGALFFNTFTLTGETLYNFINYSNGYSINNITILTIILHFSILIGLFLLITEATKDLETMFVELFNISLQNIVFVFLSFVIGAILIVNGVSFIGGSNMQGYINILIIGLFFIGPFFYLIQILYNKSIGKLGYIVDKGLPNTGDLVSLNDTSDLFSNGFIKISGKNFNVNKILNKSKEYGYKNYISLLNLIKNSGIKKGDNVLLEEIILNNENSKLPLFINYLDIIRFCFIVLVYLYILNTRNISIEKVFYNIIGLIFFYLGSEFTYLIQKYFKKTNKYKILFFSNAILTILTSYLIFIGKYIIMLFLSVVVLILYIYIVNQLKKKIDIVAFLPGLIGTILFILIF